MDKSEWATVTRASPAVYQCGHLQLTVSNGRVARCRSASQFPAARAGGATDSDIRADRVEPQINTARSKAAIRPRVELWRSASVSRPQWVALRPSGRLSRTWKSKLESIESGRLCIYLGVLDQASNVTTPAGLGAGARASARGVFAGAVGRVCRTGRVR